MEFRIIDNGIVEVLVIRSGINHRFCVRPDEDIEELLSANKVENDDGQLISAVVIAARTPERLTLFETQQIELQERLAREEAEAAEAIARAPKSEIQKLSERVAALETSGDALSKTVDVKTPRT